MNREYHPLSVHRLQPGARHHRPGQNPVRVRAVSREPIIAVDS